MPEDGLNILVEQLSDVEESALKELISEGIAAAETTGTTRLKDIQLAYDQRITADRFDNEASQALGALFGEFARRLTGWRWMRVSSEHGVEPSLVHCLVDKREHYVVHPISMITKRIEKREATDLKDLLDFMIETYEREIGPFEFQ